VAACLLAVTCADPPQVTGGEPEGSPATLTFTYEAERTDLVYIEGSLSYVRVSGPDMTTEKEIPWKEPILIEVPRGGEYRIESWVRPCSGNCNSLDAPTDHCTASVVVPDGAAMSVVIGGIVGEPCTIDVRDA
jgi:hypothetical protein